jgi:hypothetical protein
VPIVQISLKRRKRTKSAEKSFLKKIESSEQILASDIHFSVERLTAAKKQA